ncbi:hypothetical protein, partial [Halonotius pteroides]
MSNNNEETDRDLSRANTRVREQRREDAEREWRKNPIKQFEELKRKELTSKDIDNIIQNIRRFESFLLDEIAPETDAEVEGVRDVVRDDISVFRDDVLKPDTDLSNSTIAGILGMLNQFYNVLDQYNAIVGNPVDVPLDEFRDNHDLEADRPHIPFDRMETFLNWLTLPFSRAFWLAGIKHGTRMSEAINLDLRCLHIDHPIFYEIVDNHDVRIDPRVRDRPDTMLIYEAFNKGAEIPNDDTPGPETEGEIRDKAQGNKRSEEGGSVLPIDSEFKTALIDWLMSRPPTYKQTVNPLFVSDGHTTAERLGDHSIRKRLWQVDYYIDSVQNFSREETIEECPTCGGSVIEENLSSGKETGRRFRCRNCRQNHWRSIYWAKGLNTEQKMGFHVARHYFTNLHDPQKDKLHNGAIPDKVRKKRIRGDSEEDADTEDGTYKDKNYENYDTDVR